MIRLVKVFLSVLIFSHTPQALTQMLELEAIEEIKALQEVEDGFDTKVDDPDGIEKENDDLFDEIIFEKDDEVDFGYSGRRDFLVAPKKKIIEKDLKHFGYDYFEKGQTFTPRNDVPIPPDYIIGPGDKVELLLYGKKNKRYSLEVTREGIIFIPQLGPVAVSGLSFTDLKKTVSAIVVNQMVGTEVSITLSELGAINLFILGEARKPGMYTVNSLSTLTNAIFQSGGINTSGSLRNIELKREGKDIVVFDFYDLLLKGDITKDVRIMPNDVVFIPPVSKTIGINGEVERPGIYELKDSESIDDLINFAGSLKPKADLKSIEIERISNSSDGYSLISIDLAKESTREVLRKGDLVKVYPVMDRMRNVILFSGHAEEPGFYPWYEGLNLRNVIKSEQDLLPMTDTKYTLIKRVKSDQSFEVIQINLEHLFNGDLKDEIILQDMDEVIFFPKLLNVDLIDTELLENEYEDDKDFQGLTYLVKSIEERRDQEEKEEELDLVVEPGLGERDEDDKIKDKYFKYTIHDYCTLPEPMVAQIVDGVDEDENILGADQFDLILTDFCRKKLLDPINAIMAKQSTPNNGTRIFEIYGDVFFPGKYPHSENDMSLNEAINAAGGLTKSSYIDEVEITSKRYKGKQLNTSTRVVSIANRDAVKVESMDLLSIKTMANTINFVEIKGEVYFPGSYPFKEDASINDLIKRAGGIKSTASLNDAIFLRKELAELEKERLKQIQRELRRDVLLMQSKSNSAQGDSQIDFDQLTELLEEDFDDENSLGLLGRLIIDLPDIINNESSSIILEDGDSLIIPRKRNTITVIGEVYGANTHQYDEDYSIEDYINLSGGTTKFADISKSYIIKANGSIMPISSSSSGFFRSGGKGLNPGDSIVIPVKVNSLENIRTASEITKIIYEMAVAAAAISSFGN